MTPRDQKIRAEVDVLATFELLRAHVGGRADHHPRLGQRGADARDLGVAQHLGDAEVEHLDEEGISLAALGDEDVVRLDVAVDDAVLVGALQGAAHLLHQRLGGGEAEAAAALEQLGEGEAAEQLHHEVRDGVVDGAVVHDLHHVRVRDARGGAGLALEAGDERGVARGALGADELHRDVGLERDVTRRPHDPHPTLTERLEQAQLPRDDGIRA
ncbi:MAG: hypothetical protein QM820_22250 [Minicystis sp.]